MASSEAAVESEQLDDTDWRMIVWTNSGGRYCSCIMMPCNSVTQDSWLLHKTQGFKSVNRDLVLSETMLEW